LRLDEVTAGGRPDGGQEAAGIWSGRARTARGSDASRHRLSKLLLRHGHRLLRRRRWTGAHDAWLRRIGHQRPCATQLTFESDYETVLPSAPAGTGSTPRSRDGRRSRVHPDRAPAGVPARVATLTAFALAVEIGDWHRFTGNTIGSFVGLVPSEYPPAPSGSRDDHQDRNTHVRRLLIEAAGTTAPVTCRKTMRDPLGRLTSPAALSRGDQGNRRCTPVGDLPSTPQAQRDCERPAIGPASWRLVLVPGCHG
jgi:hypothetical protein